MNKKSNFKYKLKRGLLGKVLIIMSLVFLWFGTGLANKASADDNSTISYTYGSAYQFFLLSNQKDKLNQQAQATEVKKMGISLGSLGSGGVSGSFSYDDFKNGLPSASDKKIAGSFASAMATYSSFHYMTNKIQGFASVPQYFGRGLFFIILLPLGFILDILQAIIGAIVNIVAKIQFISVVGSAFVNTENGKQLANALGVSSDSLKSLTNSLLAFALVAILYSLMRALKNGSKNIDRRHANILKGRLFSLVALPLALGAGAFLIQEATQIAGKSQMANQDGFSRYMIDDRSWAYNYNFAPKGNSFAETDIKGNKYGYVDFNFNPYTKQGGDRIASINQGSNIASGFFKNTALAVSYGTSESFSAMDYLGYKGAEDNNSVGNYYGYAQKMSSTLTKTDDQYYPSGNPMNKKFEDNANPFGQAKDDYISSNDSDDSNGGSNGKLSTTPQLAWRDRYIFAAKNAGTKMDDYYKQTPSDEQIQNQVGTKNKWGISDESMYYVLQTIFNDTGGRYYIEAPARGIMATKAMFDSNRSTYNVISMVGQPALTIFGLLSQPLIEAIVLIAVLRTIIGVGVVDMNLKPGRAWLKGITLGNIEYSEAVLIYSIGIIGTILTIIAVPKVMTDLLTYAGQLMAKLLTGANSATDLGTIKSADASLASQAIGLVAQFIFSFMFAFMYWKNRKFRDKLTEILSMPWAWASGRGEKLEQSVTVSNGNTSQLAKKMRERSDQKRNYAKDKVKSGLSMLGPKGQVAATALDMIDPDSQDSSNGEGVSSSVSKLAKAGNVTRAMNSLDGVFGNMDEKNMSDDALKQKGVTEQALQDARDDPSEENVGRADKELQNLRNVMDDGTNDGDDTLSGIDDARMQLHGNDMNDDTATSDHDGLNNLTGDAMDVNSIHADNIDGLDTNGDDDKPNLGDASQLNGLNNSRDSIHDTDDNGNPANGQNGNTGNFGTANITNPNIQFPNGVNVPNSTQESRNNLENNLDTSKILGSIPNSALNGANNMYGNAANGGNGVVNNGANNGNGVNTNNGNNGAANNVIDSAHTPNTNNSESPNNGNNSVGNNSKDDVVQTVHKTEEVTNQAPNPNANNTTVNNGTANNPNVVQSSNNGVGGQGTTVNNLSKNTVINQAPKGGSVPFGNANGGNRQPNVTKNTVINQAPKGGNIPLGNNGGNSQPNITKNIQNITNNNTTAPKSPVGGLGSNNAANMARGASGLSDNVARDLNAQMNNLNHSLGSLSNNSNIQKQMNNVRNAGSDSLDKAIDNLDKTIRDATLKQGASGSSHSNIDYNEIKKQLGNLRNH